MERIFEGTWEEILLHSSELVGQRVRLTVLTDEPPNRSEPIALDKLLKNRVGQVSFQPSNLSERTGEAFMELLDTKYQSFQVVP